jgi:hypothetical protein
MNILKNKNVLGGIAAVIVIGLIYYIWSSAGSGALLTTAEPTSPLSQEILTTLGQLHTLRLDPALFKDPVFISLSDFGAAIPPQQAGRRNPFAPVGSASAPAKAPVQAPAQSGPEIPPEEPAE